jgi:hypothetical protein
MQPVGMAEPATVSVVIEEPVVVGDRRHTR